MTPLIETLLWCILQVTLVGVLALALCAALRRWSHQGNAVVPAAALAAVVVLTLCAFVPWPNWWCFGPQPQPIVAQHVLPRPVATDESHAAAAADGAAVEPSAESHEESPPVATTRDSAGIVAPAATAAGGPTLLERLISWLPLALTVGLSAGIALGLLQLAGGLLSVRSYRRASAPVTDAKIGELVDVLRAELSLTRPIELRETDKLATAATVGWARPVILLPTDWRTWTDDQRRAVLAHELAHVARGDYLACVLAQISLAIHFYHPLVHWLAARLRLEQELAADATAAELSGGKRSYLTSLAELALHTSERSLGWPAHTFLPTQGTFLRRIEMLRDARPVTPAPRPRSALRWAAVGVLVLGAALIAGLRGGPATSPFDNEATAQPPAAGTSNEAGGGIDLSQITNDAKMVLAIRPAEVLANESIRKAVTGAGADGPPILKLLMLENLEQFTLVGPPGVEPDDWNDDSLVILQFSKATAIENVVKTGAVPSDVKRLPAFPGDVIEDAQPRTMAYGTPNEKTIILGHSELLLKYLWSRRKGKPEIAAGEAWSKVSKGAIVAAVDMQVIRDEIAKEGAPRGPIPPELAALEPLWKDGEYVVAGIIIEGKTVHLREVITCQDAKLAENVADTLKAAVTLSRNSLRSIREREKNIPAFAQLMMDTAEGLLKTVKVEQSDTLVVAQTSTEIPDAKAPAAVGLLGAIGQARGAAQKAQSANNLKQIAIAMHNWHDTYKTLPPPVIYGKDGKGKVPHSWRVELLPYLDQAELYNAYQFDEPWDSEANKKVLAKMPAVFRHPTDNKDSTSAAYYVLTPAKLLDTKVLPGGGIEAPLGGLPTAFSRKIGVGFMEIIDGTSNTLMVVEAKRDIPWTMPDDILFDPEKDPPAMGGYFKDGFHAGLCDGSVRFLTPKVEPKTLKLLIMPQDGNPIPAIP
jgi:beta-lactamase regulating signal transducer with metallopeptidase domain